jgi:hypothetical protein
MLRLLIAILLFASTPDGCDVYVPTDAERARWTMSDMMSWKIVFDAYKADHKEYPVVKTVEEARLAGEPVYIRHAPMADAWGRPYRIESDGATFRVVSAGADGIFQSDIAKNGKLESFNDDAVVSNEGRWLSRSWEIK